MNNTENNVKLDVRAYPIAEPKNNVMGYASVTINDVFAVNSIRVVNSEKGLFVAMPQRKDGNGEYKDICFPVTADMRKLLNDTILGAYAVAKEKDAPAKESTVDKLREAKEEKAPPAMSNAQAAPKKSEPEL